MPAEIIRDIGTGPTPTDPFYPLARDIMYEDWPFCLHPDDQVIDQDGRISAIRHTGASNVLFSRVGSRSLFKITEIAPNVRVFDSRDAGVDAIGYDMETEVSYNLHPSNMLGGVFWRPVGSIGNGLIASVRRTTANGTTPGGKQMCSLSTGSTNGGEMYFDYSRHEADTTERVTRGSTAIGSWVPFIAFADWAASKAYFEQPATGANSPGIRVPTGTGLPNLDPARFKFLVGGNPILSGAPDSVFFGLLRCLIWGPTTTEADVLNSGEFLAFKARILAEYDAVKDIVVV